MKNDSICVAICNKPHGLKGDIKVTVLMDNPKNFLKIKGLKLDFEEDFHAVERVFAVSDGYGVKLELVDSIDAAIKFKGKKLYASKEEVNNLITEGQIYIEDLIGKTAVFENGEIVGEIEDVENYGANDIVFIKSAKFTNLSFANIGGIIDRIDFENNKVYLNKIEFDKFSVYDE